MKNNLDNKYWFKRRRYGYGWTPVTWQGFLIVILGLAAIIIAAFQLPNKPAQPTPDQLAMFYGVCAVVIVIFIVAGYLKSPKPHWRWGKRPDDNPDEDI